MWSTIIKSIFQIRMTKFWQHVIYEVRHVDLYTTLHIARLNGSMNTAKP